MTLATPSVYIGTEAMAGHALADMPVLSGLKFQWGNEDQVEFDKPGTLSCSLLIRTPANTDFLTKGAPFGLMVGTVTAWAGRITQLTARRHPSKADAMVISVTAADTLADLEQYRIKVSWAAAGGTANTTSAATRRGQIAAALPAGWTLENTNTSLDWTNAREQRWTAEPFLSVADMHLRSVLSRRHVTSQYDPAAGLVPRLTFTAERNRSVPSETLAARADGTWYATTHFPPTSGFVGLGPGMVDEEVVWDKTPDDTITDVQLKSWGINYGTPTEEATTTDSAGDYNIWVNDYPNVNNAAMQAKYGFHQVEFDVDTLGGSTGSPHVGQIVNYWVDADAQWRPTGIDVPDSRRLPDATALVILDVTKRYKAYANVDGLPPNNPAGGSRVRAYIIAGEAEWTGKKWRFGLTFGRVPRAPATGGVLTFDSIKNHATPAINAGTAETIGTQITFADFAYIGA